MGVVGNEISSKTLTEVKITMKKKPNRCVGNLNNLEFNARNQEVSFDHTCILCGHKIATHEYSFSVGDQFQEYSMNCMLCG